MSSFVITTLQDASILALNDMREEILIDPDYQRPGGVWSLNKQQLFIDSLLNKYDVPKFYLHHLTGPFSDPKFEYSIIDGRQRLEAIWNFIDGRFPLSKDFVFLEDPKLNAGGMTFKELHEEYPRLVTRLHSRSLAVMVVVADDIDLIEDMFSRLNEAVPLNAAERRNAFGGPLPSIIRDLVKHGFFEHRIRVSSTRYRHHDLGAKLLYLESNEEIVDTKKASLDYFVRDNREEKRQDFDNVVEAVTENLDNMMKTFVDGDPLLRSSGVIPVYYVLFSTLRKEGWKGQIKRKKLEDFEERRARNRELFAEEKKGVDFKLIEFDELAQSSNDAASIRQRYATLREFLKV